MLTSQIAELRDRQDKESQARKDIENDLIVIREEFQEINNKTRISSSVSNSINI